MDQFSINSFFNLLFINFYIIFLKDETIRGNNENILNFIESTARTRS